MRKREVVFRADAAFAISSDCWRRRRLPEKKNALRRIEGLRLGVSQSDARSQKWEFRLRGEFDV
jgi:hypothetical protein